MKESRKIAEGLAPRKPSFFLILRGYNARPSAQSDRHDCVEAQKNGKEYAIALHGILTIASGKHKKVGTNDPIMQQVIMMADYDGSHENGEQE